MNIGKAVIPHGIFLAPLASVADAPFRMICRGFGAECVTTEMVSSKAVHYSDAKSFAIADTRLDRHPVGIQIFGSDPECMAESAVSLSKLSPDFFDINMGCPVKKVVSCGDGSALMRNPALCGKIVEAVVKATDIPVTVKIRAGFDSAHINAPEVAAVCESAGASAVTVHGRTREMMYSGKADRAVIAAVKAAVSIPVIGNGDINSAADVLSMINETGCDGIMVARGSLGRPWLFAEILAALSGKEIPVIPLREQGLTVMRHIALQTEYGDGSLLVLRKHLAWYTRGMAGSAAVRRLMNSAVTREDFDAIVRDIYGL